MLAREAQAEFCVRLERTLAERKKQRVLEQARRVIVRLRWRAAVAVVVSQERQRHCLAAAAAAAGLQRMAEAMRFRLATQTVRRYILTKLMRRRAMAAVSGRAAARLGGETASTLAAIGSAAAALGEVCLILLPQRPSCEPFLQYLSSLSV